MRFEQVEARGVMLVVAIDVCVERAGIDDQSDEPTSLARISSIRSEMSERPLAPAPAARSRRFPRGAASSVSIASRVSSDTVVPRRSASWRSRASRSSGSLTVVRCMYASIPSSRRRVIAFVSGLPIGDAPWTVRETGRRFPVTASGTTSTSTRQTPWRTFFTPPDPR